MAMIDLKQFKTILTFFAHPDDETLAAGATIKKLTNCVVGRVKFM
jgi:LmbE family N-acetylglucosaminyl deacetylase